jgi:hypothetical protein
VFCRHLCSDRNKFRPSIALKSAASNTLRKQKKQRDREKERTRESREYLAYRELQATNEYLLDLLVSTKTKYCFLFYQWPIKNWKNRYSIVCRTFPCQYSLERVIEKRKKRDREWVSEWESESERESVCMWWCVFKERKRQSPLCMCVRYICVNVCVSHRVRKKGVSVWRERSTNSSIVHLAKLF